MFVKHVIHPAELRDYELRRTVAAYLNNPVGDIIIGAVPRVAADIGESPQQCAPRVIMNADSRTPAA